ncbi:MAG: U32 family peptidase [Ruminococcus sp.]
MKNKIEILSPCGGFDSVVAAVRSGADAIYLGAKDFSARASAENFDFEELKNAVDYCHIRGVLVYLTLNTVIFDRELEKAKETIICAAKAQVDALIVQNIGVAALAKKIAPELPLHGSTQMSIHSPSGARLLWEMGFKRVVLSREMSRDEIKEVVESCPIETEVFVHGALCMSVSGQCYFSAVLGSRSGNRGRCAQPCRLPFKVNNTEGFALSLKDNSIIEHLKDLESIGVTSAKIEGRMKRPEYVAAATSACAEARNTGTVSAETEKNLNSVFSRTGFTDGYYTGNRGYEMFGYRKKEDVISATEALLSNIRVSYKDEKPRVKIHGDFIAQIGKVPVLTVTDGINSVTVQGENPCEKAIKMPLNEEKCRKQILKTGGTPYLFENLSLTLENGVTMPFSELNLLRRTALEKLSRQRKSQHNYEIFDIEIPKNVHTKADKKRTYARFTTAKIGSGFKELDLCFVPVFSNESQVESLLKEGFKVGVEIPRGLFSREKRIKAQLEKFKKIGVKDVLCNNLGAVYMAKETGMIIHGGFGLNFVNTMDLIWAEEYGFADTELSFELTFPQIESLGGKLPRGIITYGYLPLMLTRNCPNKSQNVDCSTCKKQSKMKDRLNKTFIFYCDGCCSEILNTVPLEVLEKANKLSNVDFQVFRFSVENSVENVENIPDFFSETLNLQKKTHGLYFRGII